MPIVSSCICEGKGSTLQSEHRKQTKESTDIPEKESTDILEKESTDIPEKESTDILEKESTDIPEKESTDILEKDRRQEQLVLRKLEQEEKKRKEERKEKKKDTDPFRGAAVQLAVLNKNSKLCKNSLWQHRAILAMPMKTGSALLCFPVSGASDINTDYGSIRALNLDMGSFSSPGPNITMALGDNQATHLSTLTISNSSVPISYFLDEPVLNYALSKGALIADGRSNPSGSEDQKKCLEVFQSTMSNHEDLNQRSGKAVVTFRFQPAKQPTSGRLVIRGVNVPDTTNPDLLLEAPPAKQQRSQQRVVGGRKQARGWQGGPVSHFFDVECLLETEQ
ncbi:hypothetical protein STEG23_026027, partial [Scotinomys teguina]